MVDAVITYVDGNDPLWREDYEKTNGGTPLTKRYRDWGTLPYLLRGIRKFLPFVDNVYLVVSRSSQVPSWVDTGNLRVILHEDIMPEELLPTFNSASIELFLHRIPGLKDKYIYFNDDTFPVAPMQESDFFDGGRTVGGYASCLFAFNLFKRHTRNSDRFARKAAGVGKSLFFKRPQHICSSMSRPLCEELFERFREEMISTASPLREDRNLNQYVYRDYALFRGMAVSRRIPSRHMSLASSSISSIRDFLSSPTAPVVCINDVQMPQERVPALRTALLQAFDKLLGEKSEFEI